MKDRIVVRGARQNNLKGVDVDLPRRAFVVVTGPSGSGKSSLAFDTIYAEGQRRYVESLSTYAKQFLERMEKADVDRVDGISPSVAIEQRNPTKTSRSTVGTATEAHDALRVLWARAGRTVCPGRPADPCGREVIPDTVQSATDAALALPTGERFQITFPLPRSARVSHELLSENLRALGFVRLLADGEAHHLDDPDLPSDLTACEDLLVVVDRLRSGEAERGRIADAFQTAFHEGDGSAVLLRGEGERRRFSERFQCPDHPEIDFARPRPQLFSFNNPYGSCPECTGFGAVLRYDPELIIPNPERSIDEGAVDPWSKPRYRTRRAKLALLAKKYDVSTRDPWHTLPETFRQGVVHGEKGFEGVIPFLGSIEKKRYKQYIRVFLRQYQSAQACPLCAGGRLRPEALRVSVAGLSLPEVCEWPITRLAEWVEAIAESPTQHGLREVEAAACRLVFGQLRARLDYLSAVGLGYLTLARQTRTLSGGEAQRISLANAVGSRLVDTLYVLDEPTIGLHPADNDRLLGLLERLRDEGGSVVVVEHDAEAIGRADHVIELGPGSGEHGGTVVFEGTVEALREADTTTGRFLSGRESVPVPEKRRPATTRRLRLRGAREHNLRGVDVDVPLGTLTVVTGVSGSGKSTLVHDILYRAVERELGGGETTAKRHLGERIGAYDRLEGVGALDQVVLMDQSPIGRTPRSNPVTYIKVYDHIRQLFAAQPEARARGYAARHFSFNVQGGRCEACKGDGQVRVEMVFLADVFVPCEACQGTRFRREVLDIRYRDRSIHDVLEMTVDEAMRFFLQQDRIGQGLWHLQRVGLGYLRLGQPAPTLSGGEAQRIKIARELARGARGKGRTLYILDEPTTGLSMGDVRTLLRVLGELVNAGHTVLVIEHDLAVVRSADWVIDMGPGAGPEGGSVVGMGPPEHIMSLSASITGRYLLGSTAVQDATAAGTSSARG